MFLSPLAGMTTATGPEGAGTITMTDKIVVQDVYKIFGPKPDVARDLIEQGYTKEQIFEQTGHTVGVQKADFSIQEGEIFVVMGLSGSGKSTMVRMLNRLIDPTYGEVRINGQDITKMSSQELIDLRRKDMSMVFQSFALMPQRARQASGSRSPASTAKSATSAPWRRSSRSA